MKRHLSSCLLICSAVFTLHSCATSSVSRDQRKAEIENSKELSAACFVKMNDGTIKSFTTLKLVTSPFSTPYLLADGKTKFKSKEILAYQNKNHYAVSQRTFCCGRMSSVATETLPGFAVRTVKGKLNIYCKKYYNGQTAVDEYFIQEGNDGKIQAYSAGLMAEILKNNSEALNFFNSKFKGNNAEKLIATAQLYNGNPLLSKN